MRRCIVSALVALAAVTAADAASGQAYPTRPIRVVVPFPPGGNVDTFARMLFRYVEEDLGQPMVIDNRGGANGIVGADTVAKAAPDGYTIMATSFGLAVNQYLVKKLPFDLRTDFLPVTNIALGTGYLMVAHPAFPAKTVKDVIALAKSQPGQIRYSTAGVGNGQHLAGALFALKAGVDMLHVPYKGAAAAHQEMMGGRLDLMFDNLSASKQYVQAGRLKGLAVSSASRSPHLPSVPTVNETGLVQFEGESWFGLFAPAGTPVRVVQTLRNALAGIIRDPEFAARIERDGGRVLASPPQQQQFLQAEVERWSRLVGQYGVTVE